MSTTNDQRVVCAAIRHPDGRLICSPRHFDMTTHAVLDHLEKTEDIRAWGQADQGFVQKWHVKFTTCAQLLRKVPHADRLSNPGGLYPDPRPRCVNDRGLI